jgi:hypothetical protein
VLGATLRDLTLFKDVGKLAMASAVVGLLCLFVRSLLIAGGFGSLMILTICFVVFAALYLTAILMMGIPTRDERLKVRRGVERLQQFVYVGGSAN